VDIIASPRRYFARDPPAKQLDAANQTTDQVRTLIRR
jgi:hypothetical protein